MFQVNRKALLGELALLQSAAEPKTTLPILAFIKFDFDGERLALTATNIDVSVITELTEVIGEPWSGCLPSAQLYSLVKLLSDETVTFTLKDERMEVKAGRARHKLPVMPVDDFPEIERHEAESVTVEAAMFSVMLGHVSFASLSAGDGPTNQEKFKGVNLAVKDGRLQLTATNIARLASVSCPVDSTLSFEVIIPPQAIGPLEGIKDGSLSIDASEHHAHFANGKRHIYTRLLNGKFPDWEAMFPKAYEHVAELNTDELGGSIRRAMLTQGEERLIIIGQRWTWANGELLIETRGGDKGKSDEIVEIACPSLNGSSVAVGMNGQQMLDALPRLGEKAVLGFSNGASIVQVRPQQPSPVNFVYYVNTVNLKNWQ